MRHSKNKSIRIRIRNLLLGVILFLVIMGCSITVLIFTNILKNEKTKQIQTIMNTLYDEAVTETKENVDTQANALSRVLARQDDLVKRSKFTQEELQKMFPDIEYAIYDRNDRLTYTTDADVFAIYKDASVLKEQEHVFLGDQEVGIYYFNKNEIHNQAKERLGYIVAFDKVTKQEYIQNIKEKFHIDATIFYKDMRIVTTIVNHDKGITGTKLTPKLSVKMLKEPTSFSGMTFILGKPFITSYKSFGNPGEEPVGIIFVGESFLQYSKSFIFVIFAIILLSLLLFILVTKLSGRWIERNILQPMLQTTKLIDEIVDGNAIDSKSLEKGSRHNEFENLIDLIKGLLGNLKKSKGEMELIAYYDQLTKLPNRFSLFRKNPNTLEYVQQLSGLILFDLDDLKTVNELYGVKIGDTLIEEIGKFISVQLQEQFEYKSYRIGGGTFALIVEATTDMERMESIVKILMQRFTKPFIFDDVSLKITISIGIALRTSVEETMEEVLYHAELAMAEVKNALKNDYLFYRQEIGDNLRKRKDMELDLKKALERDEFFLVYQPKFNLKTKKFDCFEALIRWNSPERGLVSPADFIDIAEESGLIVPIGNWVLQEASKSVKELSIQLGFPYKVAVNISPVQINRDDFFKTICETLLNSELDSSQLELEITENLLMSSFSTAVEKLRQLYVLGVSIAVDDFGKGYSSLAYLHELPIHTLKIDKMFIDVIKDNEETMVGDIIRLGHNMQLMIVAEGVENETQKDYLELSGCDMIQGYYYSKPLPLDKLEIFLRENHESKEIIN